jgi:hypothetical protein
MFIVTQLGEQLLGFSQSSPPSLALFIHLSFLAGYSFPSLASRLFFEGRARGIAPGLYCAPVCLHFICFLRSSSRYVQRERVCVFISNDPMSSLFYMYVLHFQDQRLLQFLHTYRHSSTGWHRHLCADGELSTSGTISPYAPGFCLNIVSNLCVKHKYERLEPCIYICALCLLRLFFLDSCHCTRPLFNHIGGHARCTIS